MTDIPKVMLGGREWEIPILAVMQNRIVTPAVMSLMPVLVRIAAAYGKIESDPLWFIGIDLTTKDFDLLCDAA